MKSTRIALMGIGKIGCELFRRTVNNKAISYVAVGDSSGFLVKKTCFSDCELTGIIDYKVKGNKIVNYDNLLYAGKCIQDILRDYEIDILIDVTAEQTNKILLKSLEFSNIITSNKLPFADVPFADYKQLVDRAISCNRFIDYGTTVGAGLKIPEIARNFSTEGIVSFSGCLSGTMNYLSQRLNKGIKLSDAIHEAMNPPRYYAEADPRVDLSGEDFRRKMVILSRILGKQIELNHIKIESILKEEYKKLNKDDFMNRLPELDNDLAIKASNANKRERILWYTGNANLVSDEYQIGFHEIPSNDIITQCRESDNIIKIQPRLWRRPVIVIGPGAGTIETVTGLIRGLTSIVN